MKLPVFRWIIGDVSEQGFEIFSECIRRTTQTYCGKFEWLICSNVKDVKNLEKLERISQKRKVAVYQQDWSDFPLDPTIIPKLYDINEEFGVPSGRQGSFWKICPPRMFNDRHEIVCDNDLMIIKPLSFIDQFLNEHKVLLSSEDAHSVGKYFKHFNSGEVYNSGLYGLPPYYDFEEDLKLNWVKLGSFAPLLSRDEQGLITCTLKQNPSIIIPSGIIVHLFSDGRCNSCDYDVISEMNIESRIIKNIHCVDYTMSKNDSGYHFLRSNENYHQYWMKYLAGGL